MAADLFASMYGVIVIFGTALLIYLAILAFLMPVFVYRIKNEIVKSNKHLKDLNELLEIALTAQMEKGEL